jgi:nucleoside-diphosphate-sugar epimerase
MTPERKRVALLSGATGFVGSHLARGLAERGWRVHGLVRASSDRSILEGVGASPELHELDGSTEGLCGILAEVKPDTVFHLASLFLARHEAADVEPLVRDNLLFGTQLIEAAGRSGVRRFVNTGTSWQHHDGRDEPVNRYAALKRAFEHVVDAYVAMTPMRALTLKLFDTYGPADPRPKLLSLLLDAAESGETLPMSPGEQLIDLLHVDDVVEAFAVAAERLESLEDGRHESFALRSGRLVSLKELVSLLSAAGAPASIDWGGRPYREREVMRPWSGGVVLPGWSPRLSLEEGLDALVSERGES